MKISTKKKTSTKLDLEFTSEMPGCVCNDDDPEPCISCWAGEDETPPRKAGKERDAEYRMRIARIRDALKRHGLPSSKEAALLWFTEVHDYDIDERVESWLAAGFINPVVVGQLACYHLRSPAAASRAVALVASVHQAAPFDSDGEELIEIEGRPGAETINLRGVHPKKVA